MRRRVVPRGLWAVLFFLNRLIPSRLKVGLECFRASRSRYFWRA